jgi:hypothetical protein
LDDEIGFVADDDSSSNIPFFGFSCFGFFGDSCGKGFDLPGFHMMVVLLVCAAGEYFQVFLYH